jgi:hypothetical protein
MCARRVATQTIEVSSNSQGFVNAWERDCRCQPSMLLALNYQGIGIGRELAYERPAAPATGFAGSDATTAPCYGPASQADSMAGHNCGAWPQPVIDGW